MQAQLFQIPQRYRFSSKSQQTRKKCNAGASCFRYHKGTDFQANHNKLLSTFCSYLLFQIPQRYRFSSKSQLNEALQENEWCCFRYHKGTDFQANHNKSIMRYNTYCVVLDTTKVQIFKQITTEHDQLLDDSLLFQIPQRYRFSSKSQPVFWCIS